MTKDEYLDGWLRCVVTERMNDMYPEINGDFRASTFNAIVKALKGEIAEEISNDWLDNAILAALDAEVDKIDWGKYKDL